MTDQPDESSLRLELMATDIEYRKAQARREKQDLWIQPLRLLVAAITSAAAILGAGIAIGRFLLHG